MNVHAYLDIGPDLPIRAGRPLSVPAAYILHDPQTKVICFPVMDIVKLEGHDDPLYAGGAAEMVGLHIASFWEHY